MDKTAETAKSSEKISSVITIFIFFFWLTVTTIAQTIFVYIFFANKNNINFTDTSEKKSFFIAWLPIFFLVTTLFFLVSAHSSITSSFVYSEERAREIMKHPGGDIEKDTFSQRHIGLYAGFMIVSVVFIIFSGITMGYIFITRASDYIRPFILLGLSHFIMIVSTIVMAISIIAGKDIIFFQVERKKGETGQVSSTTSTEKTSDEDIEIASIDQPTAETTKNAP